MHRQFAAATERLSTRAGEFNKLSELTSQEWDEIAALTRGKKEGGEGPNAN